jgi:hypothetical protein
MGIVGNDVMYVESLSPLIERERYYLVEIIHATCLEQHDTLSIVPTITTSLNLNIRNRLRNP